MKSIWEWPEELVAPPALYAQVKEKLDNGQIAEITNFFELQQRAIICSRLIQTRICVLKVCHEKLSDIFLFILGQKVKILRTL